jgi:hypothetical protein
MGGCDSEVTPVFGKAPGEVRDGSLNDVKSVAKTGRFGGWAGAWLGDSERSADMATL